MLYISDFAMLRRCAWPERAVHMDDGPTTPRSQVCASKDPSDD